MLPGFFEGWLGLLKRFWSRIWKIREFWNDWCRFSEIYPQRESFLRSGFAFLVVLLGLLLCFLPFIWLDSLFSHSQLLFLITHLFQIETSGIWDRLISFEKRAQSMLLCQFSKIGWSGCLGETCRCCRLPDLKEKPSAFRVPHSKKYRESSGVGQFGLVRRIAYKSDWEDRQSVSIRLSLLTLVGGTGNRGASFYPGIPYRSQAQGLVHCEVSAGCLRAFWFPLYTKKMRSLPSSLIAVEIYGY